MNRHSAEWMLHGYFIGLDVEAGTVLHACTAKEFALAAEFAAPSLERGRVASAFDAAVSKAGWHIFNRLDLRLIAIAASVAYAAGKDRAGAAKLAYHALSSQGFVDELRWSADIDDAIWNRAAVWRFFNREPYALPFSITRRVAELVEIDTRLIDAFEAVRYAVARMRGVA